MGHTVFGVMEEEKQGSIRVFRAVVMMEFGGEFGKDQGNPMLLRRQNPHCIIATLSQGSDLDVMG